MKNPSDPTGNRTRDLPACSAVPQPTTLPRSADIHTACYKYYATRGNHDGVSFNFLKSVIKEYGGRASVEKPYSNRAICFRCSSDVWSDTLENV